MKTELCKMKEVFGKIDRLQEQITELNRNAFEQLCNIIREVCSKEDEGVEKIGKGCFIVKASTLIGRPWSIDYVSNEVAGKVLTDKVTKIFSKRERMEDVLNYLNELVSKAVGNSVIVEKERGETRWGSITNNRAIKKSLVVKILTLCDE